MKDVCLSPKGFETENFFKKKQKFVQNGTKPGTSMTWFQVSFISHIKKIKCTSPDSEDINNVNNRVNILIYLLLFSSKQAFYFLVTEFVFF